MRALFGFLVALALIPAASAIEISTNGPDAPLIPGEAWAGEATLTIFCRDILEAGTSTTATVALDYTIPEHISFDGPDAVEIEKTRCLPNQTDIEETIHFAVSGTTAILAMQPQPISIHAKLADSDREGEVEIRVSMEYVGGFDVSTPIQVKKAGPQKQISYEIQLTNLANGPTKIYFQMANHLKDDAKGQIILPDIVILDAAGGERDTATAVITYATPFENGSNYVEDEFAIQVMGEYIYDPSRKANNTEVVEFGAITEGMYVPGPGLLLAPGLLVLVALLRRRA